MRVWVLGSGSRGNAVLLECGDSRVLIDAGFSVRSLAERFAAIGLAPEAVEGVVLTHEHADHVRGACAGARQWGWALHATPGTVEGCPTLADADVRTFEPGGTISFDRIDVRTVAVSHDAGEPVAVVATSRATGARAAVLYDLGVVTPQVLDAAREVDVLVLEANHEEGMLRAGPYPPSVQQRIGGRLGHLSNRAAADLARRSAHAALNHLVLAHLSESCNEQRLAVRAVADGVAGTRFRGTVHCAPQDVVIGPFAPRASRLRLGTQLALNL